MFETIAIFNYQHEAHIARSILHANGIPAFILDDHVMTINPAYSFALGGVKLQVRQTETEPAREVLLRTSFSSNLIYEV